MHELFASVLDKRDLSRAGDLFQIQDSEIVNDLTEVLLEIADIVAQPEYLQNKNHQSVIEICTARVTACIRETDTCERHIIGMISLLETCFDFNLKPSKNNEDSPHAKISSDIISSVFLNYTKKPVMELALPVVIPFLNKENKELSKNLASYLSLAAIEYKSLLSPYVEIILNSLLGGNYSLSRVLSQLYDSSTEATETIIMSTRNIIDILPKCENLDKNILLQLIANIIIDSNGSNSGIFLLIIDKLPQFFDLVLSSSTATASLNVMLRLAEKKPLVFIDYIDLLILTAQKLSSTICLVGQILSAIGRKNKDKAHIALEFILENFSNTDRSSQAILLNEAVKLCTQYPILFNDKLTAVIRQKNLSQQNLLVNKNVTNGQTHSGNVTIVKLNSSTSTSRLTSDGPPPVSVKSHHQVLVNNMNNNSNNNNNATTVINTSNGQTHSIVPLLQGGNYLVNGNVVSTGYTRRPKFGDSRSTGRLHGGTGITSNTHRSMTRLNVASGINVGVNTSNLGGLHKSMSSSQQIHQANLAADSSNNFITSTIPPPLSQHVQITGENKWGIPSTKITSGGVTVISRTRPFSQGPSTLLGSTDVVKSSSTGLNILNHSTGSIGGQNGVSVHHATPLPLYTNNNQQSMSSLSPIPVPPPPLESENEVIVSGPQTAVTTRKNNNKSVTLLNVNSARMSVFEPSPMRDTIQHFCEKHLEKIKGYMSGVLHKLPPPAKCTIEERRGKKFAKLHFACQIRESHCLYSKTFFSFRTRNAKTWIHLMFLDLQSRAPNALSSWDPSVSSLRHCWDTLKFENRTFITLVTSAFPHVKEQDVLLNELRNSGFFDVFEMGPVVNKSSNSLDDDQYNWGCFLCNHPEKAIGFLENNTQPVIEGQLKEKKGKWRLFKRWRTRYFTLSGAHLSCKGSSGGDASIDINQIRSVKVSRGARNIPKAFEIFTGDQTLILKPKDAEKAEEWVQYLSIVVAHSQARDFSINKSNSLPASSSSRNIVNSRTVF